MGVRPPQRAEREELLFRRRGARTPAQAPASVGLLKAHLNPRPAPSPPPRGAGRPLPVPTPGTGEARRADTPGKPSSRVSELQTRRRLRGRLPGKEGVQGHCRSGQAPGPCPARSLSRVPGALPSRCDSHAGHQSEGVTVSARQPPPGTGSCWVSVPRGHRGCAEPGEVVSWGPLGQLWGEGCLCGPWPPPSF